MDFLESLRSAINKRNYAEAVIYIQKACEEVLEYKKVTECSPLEEAIGEISQIIIPQTASEVFSETVKSDYGIEVKIGKMKVSNVESCRCWQYENPLTENPEGIIINVFYGGDILDNLRLLWEKKWSKKLPPIKIRVYGKRWQNKGRLIPVPKCYVEHNLRLLPDVPFIRNIDFERFIKIIKRYSSELDYYNGRNNE